MTYASLFSILFYSVCVVLLVLGILVLHENHKAAANRSFFALIVAITIWSASFGMANTSLDVARADIWRRIAALGWGVGYSIYLHFILIITKQNKVLKRRWFYLFLYLPAIISIIVFSIPTSINPQPYHLYQTAFGWVNVSEKNIWDIFFYVYYIGYMSIGLILLWRQGKYAQSLRVKRQARFIFIFFLVGLLLASFTDVILSAIVPSLPQMAPIVMLIPISAIYYSIRKHRFIVSKPVDTKGNYINVFLLVLIYFLLSRAIIRPQFPEFLMINQYSMRGIFIQLQMFISIYMVIKEQMLGYIANILLNSASIVISLIYAVLHQSSESFPGVFSYVGVLLITMLIINYKNMTATQLEEINAQKNKLEDSELELYNMAYYDTLTGLYNKEWFNQNLEEEVEKAKANDTMLGVIFVDLDFFKSVNDTMGHATGDLVLEEVGKRLIACVRESDSIARFGGDEFLISVVNIGRLEELHAVSNRILNTFKKAITVNEIDYFVTGSLGVAVFPYDGENAETLVKNADIAMYLAKGRGKNQCVYCSTDIKKNVTKNMKLTNYLYRALEEDELYLHYQPQVEVDTGRIVGFEALLRWNNKEFGQVTPDVFIPMAESTGLIRPIGLWVFRTACQAFSQFKEMYKESIISINVSLDQLKDTNFSTKISQILVDTKTDPRDVHIEITESIAFNKEPIILERLLEIKELGLSISIDDFGTGFSSFSRLKTFPIDVLKIDMDFVRGITTGSYKDLAIIKSIIQIAKNLKIKAVAEGVETEKEFLYLKEHGCDLIQGYYFYKPMSVEDLKGQGLR
jgi:diguanylate cyclase (GGDEF)-like protein